MINPRAFVFAALLLVSAVLCASANFRAGAQEKLPSPKGHINDFAEVLDAPTRKRLETVLENLKQRANLSFTIAMVKSAGAENLYDYSSRVAAEWNLGAMQSPGKSMLLVITTGDGLFFTQVSKQARSSLPDGLLGEMGQRMRPRFSSGDYTGGLLDGLRAFANGLGERNDFTFAALDTEPGQNLLARTRPRKVESPAITSETPAPKPAETPTPAAVEAPSATPAETPAATPVDTPAPTPVASPAAVQTPAESVATPAPSPSETPAIIAPSPSPSPEAVEAKTPQPLESPSPEPVTTATAQVAVNRANNSRPSRSPAPARRTTPVTTQPASPDDELEEVELVLTKPADQRVDILKAFIASHPQSVALTRAKELIVDTHAVLGDQRFKANDIEGGLREFRLVMSELPPEFSDALFTEVVARLPMTLFLYGQRGPAAEFAKQVEPLAQQNPKRLLALLGFYLTTEDAGEANRIAESAVQLAPDSAAAHQALGAARHIALRFDDAESEYAKAVALDPKAKSAKLALADLKRSAGKTDEALSIYRELLQADPKNQSASAGMVVSLLELGKTAEAEQELTTALQSKEQARNLALLVGAAYWYMAHGGTQRALDLGDKAVSLERRYAWGEIALARALVANRNPLNAERAIRFARLYARFPTMDYELATVLAALGLYDEAVQELQRSFTLKDGVIETKLAGRHAAHANNFTELLAPERRAAIFQPVAADTEANAKTLKALLAFTNALNSAEDQTPNEKEVVASGEEFIGGDDPMRTYRQIYVAGKLLKKRVALATVRELMEKATSGVEAALNVPAATVAVQADELYEVRARALAQGGVPDLLTAPRFALSGILRGKIEDLNGLALFNSDKAADAVAHFRRALTVVPEGTPLWRAVTWHLGSALEASGNNAEALAYYIKSYLSSPDAARRSVIENVYKKVNGSLDGLDDKIGPGFSATTAPSPSPSP